MNAYDDAKVVEREAMRHLTPFIRASAFEGRFVINEKGPLAKFLQESVGDVLLTSKARHLCAVEIKAEASNEWGNFFLETWSNASEGRRNPGWMMKLACDYLFYYFVKERDLFIIDFKKLQKWAFDDESRIESAVRERRGRIWDFPEKEQKKRDQMNKTMGRVVGIDVIRKEVGFKYRKVTSTVISVNGQNMELFDIAEVAA